MCLSLAISCLIAKGDDIHSDLGVPLFLSLERSHGHSHAIAPINSKIC